MTLIEAIAHIEGYYASGIVKNRPQRNFNPGDIRWGTYAKLKGALRGDENDGTAGMAVFPDEGTGFQALRDLLAGPAYANLTIEQAINRYAPPIENNTSGYVNFVCHQVSCKATDIVKDVLA